MDVDIYVYDPDGDLIKKDTKTDRNPVVSFTPSRSGRYNIKLKLYDADASGSFCAMAIMEDAGYSVPESSLKTALENSYKWWRNAEEELDVRFHDKGRQWCLFGSILAESASTSITRLDLGDTDIAAIATSDNNAEDIDLCLVKGGEEIKCDTEEDNYPIIQYEVSNDYYYALKTTNYESSGKSFIISTIFTY